MAFLTEFDAFDSVYQYEQVDPLIGGAGGLFNTQPQQLTNRTKWLSLRLSELITHLNDGSLEFDAADGSVAVTQIADDNSTLIATNEFVHLAINQQAGRRNFIINGAMRIAQRPLTAGAYPLVAGTPRYTLDRWIADLGSGTRTGSVTNDLNQALINFGSANIKGAMKVHLGAGANTFTFRQRIENPLSLQNGGNITVSFLCSSSVTQNITVTLNIYKNSGGVTHTVNQGAISVTNTPGVIVVTLVIPPMTTPDFVSLDNTGFVELAIDLSSTLAHDFWLTNVQVEKGSFASKFEDVSEADDLIACKRFYEHLKCVVRDENIHPAPPYKSWQSISLVAKRINPTVSVANQIYTTLSGGPDFSNLNAVQDDVNSMSVNWQLTAPGTSYATVATFDAYADAEL